MNQANSSILCKYVLLGSKNTINKIKWYSFNIHLRCAWFMHTFNSKSSDTVNLMFELKVKVTFRSL